jgi:hypothetical protein
MELVGFRLEKVQVNAHFAGIVRWLIVVL